MTLPVMFLSEPVTGVDPPDLCIAPPGSISAPAVDFFLARAPPRHIAAQLESSEDRILYVKSKPVKNICPLIQKQWRSLIVLILVGLLLRRGNI